MNNHTKAIFWMLLSSMSFSMMQIIVAITADGIPLFEQLLFRNLATTFMAAWSIRKQQVRYFGQPKNRPLLLARSTIGYLGMVTIFSASASGNQGDVTTIIKMSPFIVTILAFFFLKETITKYQIIALLVAFSGACIISNPQFNSDFYPIFMAILGCVFSGSAYTLVSALKGKEPPAVIIFVFSLLSSLFSFPIVMMNFVWPSPSQFLLLAGISIFAGLGQIGLTYAYVYAKASEISIYNYSGIFFSIVFGYFFLGQDIKPSSIAGSTLVILAGLIVFWGNRPKKATV